MAMTKAQQNAALAEWLKKGSAQTRATQERLNPTGRRANTSGWTAPPRPAPAPRPAPSTWQQSRPAEQRTAGLTAWNATQPLTDRVGNWWSRTWRSVRDYGGEPGKADDIARAQNAPPQMVRNIPARYQTEDRNLVGQTEAPFTIGEGLVAENNPDFWTTGDMDLMPGSDERRANEQAEQDREERTQINRDRYTTNARSRSGIDREETFTPLSMEEWEGLSPRQKAAVQFNSDLIAAVEADRALKGYTPSPQQQEEYDNLLEEKFGTTYSEAPDGIEYAPNVAGLLENADYIPSLELGSIDDFLKLDVTISMDEVRRIDENLNAGRITGAGGQTGPAPERTPEEERLARAQYLARAQQTAFSRLEDAVQQSDVVLSNVTGISNRQEALRFGATPEVMETLSPEEEERAELYKQTLAAPEADINETVEMMRLDMADLGFSPERQQIMIDRIRGDAERAAAGQAQWYENNAETSWLPPQDVAIALGSLSAGES